MAINRIKKNKGNGSRITGRELFLELCLPGVRPFGFDLLA